MGNKNGVGNNSNSIPVRCYVNEKEYIFKNITSGAKWWYNTMPFSKECSLATYAVKINDSINGKTLKSRGKPISQNIFWEIIDDEN